MGIVFEAYRFDSLFRVFGIRRRLGGGGGGGGHTDRHVLK